MNIATSFTPATPRTEPDFSANQRPAAEQSDTSDGKAEAERAAVAVLGYN